MERKRCFVCAACSYSCPNPGLYEIGEPEIECKDCGENSGQCKDCLFENCEYCPEYKKEVKKMKPFLLFDEEKKIIRAYTEWREKNDLPDTAVNMLIYLQDHDALNLNNCREIIKEPKPLNDEITIDDFKKLANENRCQSAALKIIVDDVTQHLTAWGTSGRLIDREFVFACLNNIKTEAEKVLNEVGKNAGA